jgi:hypothetical protein
VSSAWKLRRSGRLLADGTWKAVITWRGRTVKVRVIEYHMDQVFDLPPGHPLLAAPPAGVYVRVLHDAGAGAGAACEQPDDGTIHVEVSETVTIITSLMDTAACPAGRPHRRTVRDAVGQRTGLSRNDTPRPGWRPARTQACRSMRQGVPAGAPSATT